MLIIRKFWQPVDADTKAECAFGPVPEPGRCRYQINLASEPGILGNETGICAEVVQNLSQMSVCLLVCLLVAFYSELIPASAV